jgi:3-hydroxyacyl-[acyl-carrier-protein] dehydratase
MHSALHIAADHPSFAGHFPGFPVLPGAILLDETLRTIANARAIDLTSWRISSAKFLDAVRPRDDLCVQHDAHGAGLIRFTVHVANRKVASGTLSNAPQDL